jgi:hypothetical protein
MRLLIPPGHILIRHELLVRLPQPLVLVRLNLGPDSISDVALCGRLNLPFEFQLLLVDSVTCLLAVPGPYELLHPFLLHLSIYVLVKVLPLPLLDLETL